MFVINEFIQKPHRINVQKTNLFMILFVLDQGRKNDCHVCVLFISLGFITKTAPHRGNEKDRIVAEMEVTLEETV